MWTYKDTGKQEKPRHGDARGVIERFKRACERVKFTLLERRFASITHEQELAMYERIFDSPGSKDKALNEYMLLLAYKTISGKHVTAKARRRAFLDVAMTMEFKEARNG